MSQAVCNYFGMETLAQHFRRCRVAQRVRPDATEASTLGARPKCPPEIMEIPGATQRVGKNKIIVRRLSSAR